MIALGIIVAAGGWFFLLDGVGIASGGVVVANLHLVSIANNVIYLGYFLILVGVIRKAFGLNSTSDINLPANAHAKAGGREVSFAPEKETIDRMEPRL